MIWRIFRWVFAIASASFLALSVAYWMGWFVPNDPGGSLPVRGIDISHHQGPIDWKAVAASGVSFVFIKATEGKDFQDERFRENLAGAKKAGIPCGAYHFLTLNADGAQQAENFLRTAPKGATDLPPVIDVETPPGSLFPPDESLQRNLNVFRQRLAKDYATPPIIYSSGDYIRSRLPGESIPILWLRAVLWTPESCGFPDWKFWQYSEKGRVKGIHGFVDMDVFHGSRAEFQAWLWNTPSK